MTRLPLLLLTLPACTMTASHPPVLPRTAAETSDSTRTSTHTEVLHFLGALPALPHGDRLSFSEFGTTHEGRVMPLVLASDPPLHDAASVLASGKLRILVNANIHAGEVEGKEAVQMILREIAIGRHADLLEHAVLLFVPIYNADGNERVDRHNRATQNGPEDGVGIRPNAQGLDLNRDFLKVEAPETRALLGLMQDFDPHLFMDLHTTNGSHHGYHLTYAPSLSTNIDPSLDAFQRSTLLPEVRRKMLARHDLRVFDYGNFTEDPEREWVTYDHRPRFGTNYVGLRNRLSVLSEAYSYVDFPTRIRATHAFILEVLGTAVEHRAEILNLTAEADRRAARGDFTFGHDSSLGPASLEQVLVGSVEDLLLPEDLGMRHIATGKAQPTLMPVRRGFRSARHAELPEGWILPDASRSMQDLLATHGLQFEEMDHAVDVEVEVFVTTQRKRAAVEFQGHFELSLSGAWETQRRTVPPNSIWIPAGQPLARVAAQLLEPLSEDSASTWDRLSGWEEDATADPTGPDSPVWRKKKP